MYDLISIGGISIDLYFKGNSLTYEKNRFQLAVGGKYLADTFIEGLGGGGANVAIGAKKLGLKTAVLGKIGNNVFKKIILQKLIENNISYSLCGFDDNYFNISTILLSQKGERSIIHYMTPHQKLFSETNNLNGLTKTKAVYLGSLPDISLGEKEELLLFFKKRNICTFLNLGVKDCTRPKNQILSLIKNTNVLILNGHEFSEMVKAPYNDIHFKEHVIKWYIPEISNKVVIITEGEKGSYGYNANNVIHQVAIKPNHTLDSTGAGDGYCAGFISEYIKSNNIELSMKKGAHYASRILSKIGAN